MAIAMDQQQSAAALKAARLCIKKYVPEPADTQLRKQLMSWRDAKAKEVL